MLLRKHLASSSASEDLQKVLLCLARVSHAIARSIQTADTGGAGSTNQFGEQQLAFDILSDNIIQNHLQQCGVVAQCASEEQDDFVTLTDTAPYTVVYDPLDGSSLFDVNFTIGSIFGVYQGKEVLGKSPRDQVAAAYAVYGPRTLFIFSMGSGVCECSFTEEGEPIVLRKYSPLHGEAKNYSPGNLRAITDNAAYRAVIQDWLERTLTLRYSGCMVADIHHLLVKGQGVFANVGGNTYPNGKLRILYECGPFAYLVEQLGGSASTGEKSILDVTITSIDQRTPIIAGSKSEVERVCGKLKG